MSEEPGGGLGPTQGPCTTGSRDDPGSWLGRDPVADAAAAARLPLVTEPIVRVRETAGRRRSRVYRVMRRRVSLFSRTFPAGEYFVIRLEEQRRYLGLIPWTHSTDIFSLYASRLELVARVFLGTGHVPAEGVL